MGLEQSNQLNPQDFLQYVAGLSSIFKQWTEPSQMDVLAAQQGFQSQEAEANRAHAVNLQKMQTSHQTNLALLNNLLEESTAKKQALEGYKLETSKLGIDTSGMDWASHEPDMSKIWKMVSTQGSLATDKIREEMEGVVAGLDDATNQYVNFQSNYNKILNESKDYGESTYLPQYASPNLYDKTSNALKPGATQGQFSNEDFRLMGITALSDILIPPTVKGGAYTVDINTVKKSHPELAAWLAGGEGQNMLNNLETYVKAGETWKAKHLLESIETHGANLENANKKRNEVLELLKAEAEIAQSDASTNNLNFGVSKENIDLFEKRITAIRTDVILENRKKFVNQFLGKISVKLPGYKGGLTWQEALIQNQANKGILNQWKANFIQTMSGGKAGNINLVQPYAKQIINAIANYQGNAAPDAVLLFDGVFKEQENVINELNTLQEMSIRVVNGNASPDDVKYMGADWSAGGEIKISGKTYEQSEDGLLELINDQSLGYATVISGYQALGLGSKEDFQRAELWGKTDELHLKTSNALQTAYASGDFGIDERIKAKEGLDVILGEYEKKFAPDDMDFEAKILNRLASNQALQQTVTLNNTSLSGAGGTTVTVGGQNMQVDSFGFGVDEKVLENIDYNIGTFTSKGRIPSSKQGASLRFKHVVEANVMTLKQSSNGGYNIPHPTDQKNTFVVNAPTTDKSNARKQQSHKLAAILHGYSGYIQKFIDEETDAGSRHGIYGKNKTRTFSFPDDIWIDQDSATGEWTLNEDDNQVFSGGNNNYNIHWDKNGDPYIMGYWVAENKKIYLDDYLLLTMEIEMTGGKRKHVMRNIYENLYDK